MEEVTRPTFEPGSSRLQVRRAAACVKLFGKYVQFSSEKPSKISYSQVSNSDRLTEENFKS
jgi:hypothetical protein